MRASRLEPVCRNACGVGRGVQRPAEMLARVSHTDARAMMREHLFIERNDEIMLFGKRGCSALLAGRKIMREIAGKPGASLRAASDHDGIGARRSQRCHGSFKA